jgi:hypothetical protein
LVKCPPEQAETTVKCPAIGVVLVPGILAKIKFNKYFKIKKNEK